MSLRFTDPIQVIARVVAAETGASDPDAVRIARSVQGALQRTGFAIIRRPFVAPVEER
jgi:hypothetical protein